LINFFRDAENGSEGYLPFALLISVGDGFVLPGTVAVTSVFGPLGSGKSASFYFGVLGCFARWFCHS